MALTRLRPDVQTMFAWSLFAAWLGWGACAALDVPLATPRLTGGLVFFYLDASWLPLVAALFLMSRQPLKESHGWLAASAVALTVSAQLFLLALERYASGASRAWDLANYVQPMWRSAHGLSMASAAYEGRPVWGDHGAFAMFLFAPSTLLMSHAAPGVFLLQSMLTGASVLAAYGLARALLLPPWVALASACVLGSSRALAHAARFDFHAECALPLLLLLLAWAQARGRWGWSVALTVLAVSTRDVSALTVSMLWLYWALRERSPRALVACLLSAGVGALDMLLLPRWTGWQSYVALHGSAPLDASLALRTTVLRALSTFGLGWLHPLAWLGGMPWAVAAAVSPKALVKGIDFQYGFLFVPIASLGAVHMLCVVARQRPRWLLAGVLGWVALALAVNGPPPSSLATTQGHVSSWLKLTSGLGKLVPASASVAADACAAPYVMERANLTLLCRLDTKQFQQSGVERWEEPVPDALAATHLVLRQDCEANGPCARDQVQLAQRRHGFALLGREGPFVVLRREAPRAAP